MPSSERVVWAWGGSTDVLRRSEEEEAPAWQSWGGSRRRGGHWREGSWLLRCHPHPACFYPWGQKEHQHPQHRSPSPRGAEHPMAALHWGGRDGGCTGQLRVSCRKLSFQHKGDQQLEDVHLQKHWGHGWEGGTARGVPTVVGGYGGAAWGQGRGCFRDLLAPASLAQWSCKRGKR